MNAKEALAKLGALEAAHCGEGAEEPVAGFACLEEVIEAVAQSI